MDSDIIQLAESCSDVLTDYFNTEYNLRRWLTEYGTVEKCIPGFRHFCILRRALELDSIISWWTGGQRVLDTYYPLKYLGLLTQAHF